MLKAPNSGRVIERKNAPPLPEKLPGAFVVIEYQKETERYLIHLDDATRSSYDLGGDIQRIMRTFDRWGYSQLLCDSLDFAREFGAAQAVFQSGRTIPLFDRGAGDAEKRHRISMPIEDDSVSGSVALPGLKG